MSNQNIKATQMFIEVLWKDIELRRIYQLDCAFRQAGIDVAFVERLPTRHMLEEYSPHVTQVMLEILAPVEGIKND